MDKNEVLSPEEANAEQEALKEAKVDEIRAAVIEEFSFDEELDADKIEKLVNKEVEHRKKLSQAIGQKIAYRTKAQAKETTPEPKPKTVATPEPEDLDKKVTEKLVAVLEERDLEAMPYSKELKDEIKRVSAITGVSVKQAAKDPYIQNKLEAWEKEQKNDEASVTRNNKSSSAKTFDINNPPNVDMSTPEGRKKWDEWKVAVAKTS